MSGDQTRFTFDPTKLFSGVHKQQGRVSLDADFNEFEEILDRHARSIAGDTFGTAPGPVSVVPATTPDGFRIGVSGANLTIGPGRAYVDGIQAECFGDLTDTAKVAFDPVVGNDRSSTPLPFVAQTFWYTPGFPVYVGPTNDLLYLDVWQRDVTSWEDERLLDAALGGPDTDTRIQTAWQVKALIGDAKTTCDNPPATWAGLIAPSTARLTATASATLITPGPCVIQPAGGYTGLENRLYRVEIHQSGTPGTPGTLGAKNATFVWSRDNASLVAAVLSIKKVGAISVITVESTGRDTWLRFEVGNTIELLNDDTEFALRDTGKGGDLAGITAVNHATGEITINKDLSAFKTTGARHPRIRRWDTSAKAPIAERAVADGTVYELEEGIQVSWGDLTGTHAGDTLHAGDYWVFAARTADGSIENVDDRPPRGIIHHFMKLAVVSGSPPVADPNQDCRVLWPYGCDCDGGCDCDRCVTVESHKSNKLTIQQAIDEVIALGGGSVCIGVGTFPLRAGLKISGGVAVRVRGKGATTIIEYANEGPALLVANSVDIAIRDLTVLTVRRGKTSEDAVIVRNAALVDFDRLIVVEDLVGMETFIAKGGAPGPMGAAIGLDGLVIGSTVRRCLLAGGGGVVSPPSNAGGAAKYVVLAEATIERNVVVAVDTGVALGSSRSPTHVHFLDRTTVRDCSIYGCTDAGVFVSGTVSLGQVRVANNSIGVSGSGILFATDQTTVEGNLVTALSRERRQPVPGIAVIDGPQDLVRHGRVLENRIAQFGWPGVLVTTFVRDLQVVGNAIDRCGGGIVMRERTGAEGFLIEANTITDVDVVEEDSGPFGISLDGAVDGAIVDNVVRRIGLRSPVTSRTFGIRMMTCPSVRVAGNVVDQVGPFSDDTLSIGIGALDTFDRLDILDNDVRPSPDSTHGRWYALRIDAPRGPLEFKIGPASWMILNGQLIFIGWVVANTEQPGQMLIRGNHLLAAANSATVEILTDRSCTFTDNYCTHATSQPDIVVDLQVAILALSANQVRQPKPNIAIRIRGIIGAQAPASSPLAYTAIGNLTDGPIQYPNGNPSPWFPLNVRLT